MKKRMGSKMLLPLLLAFMMVLSACASGKGNDATQPTPSNAQNQTNNEKKSTEEGLHSIEDFSNIKTNEGEPINGGTITYGLISDAPFEGILNYNFSDGIPDARVQMWFDEPLLTWDKNYVYTNDGAATYEVSEDGRTFTFTIRDNVNWHDGMPVTAQDWEFAHEVIGHKDYDGSRYGADFTNIEGMVEYREGKADKISGIKVLSDKKLQITYIKSTPSLLTGSIWIYPLAKHIFGGMEVAKMSSSSAVRTKPVGIGPFKVESIVPGESVVYVKNSDY